MTCAVGDCERPRRGSGELCNLHRQRVRKHGDPSRGRWPSTWDRFVDRVLVLADDCWLWLGSGMGRKFEYGQFWFNNTNGLAHRYSYETLIGPTPVGMQLDHLCRRTKCVNPAHLEPVTALENTRRMHAAKKGRA